MIGRMSRVALVGAFMLWLEAPGLTTPDDQSWQWAVSGNLLQERLVGLLMLPEVIGQGCGAIDQKSVDLYRTPSTATPPFGSITLVVTDRQPNESCGSAQVTVRRAERGADEELPTDEIEYEVPAAIVYQRSGSWFRVALQRGSAWVKRENPKDFRSYPEMMMTGHLDYLKKGWDGTLWRTPGAGAATRVPAGWRAHLADNIPIDVLGVRRVRNQVWIHVRLNTESCGQTLSGVRSATGWLPAFRPSGATSAWFYSRGC